MMSDSSRIGLGTANLVGGLNRRAAVRLVHAALDHGVRYFDTAPLYGMGSAEATLAEALRGRRDGVTVATKVGLRFAPTPALKLLARSAVAPFRARFPALRRAPAPPSPEIDLGPRGCFDLPFVEASVDQSMRRLGTDRLDVLLLHEARAADLDDALLRYLEHGKASGRFGRLGIGSRRGDVEAILADHADLFDIAQYSWNVADPKALAHPSAVTHTHRTVMDALAALRGQLADARWRAAASHAAGMDLADTAVLARVLIGAALALNPAGLALVASRSIARMRSNLMAAHHPAYQAAGARLRSFLKGEDGSRP